MSNPFYSAMNNSNPMAMMAQFRSDPLGFLRKAGYNVPNNINDPNAIIQHLMNTGQVSQQQMNNAHLFAQRFGMR